MQANIPFSSYFANVADCHQYNGSFEKKHKLLPLLPGKGFADVSMGWNETGLHFYVSVSVNSIAVAYPEIQKGDSIELFIDTKNLKNAKLIHRFCHHFYFLPESVEGVRCKEITHFRSVDVHPLCRPEDLQLKIKKRKGGYDAEIFIPTESLTGYQPEVGQLLGFSYRVNRSTGAPQDSMLSSTDYPIESRPNLWGSVKLVGI